MKNALLLSLGLHIAVTVLVVRLVRIAQVRFVPRDVLTVSLVSMAEAEERTIPKEEQPPPPAPEPEPKPVEEEEFAPPPEEKKVPEKPKEVEKTIPTTDERKEEPPGPGTGEESAEPVATGDIALDGQEFPYAYYLATMRRKIASLWRVPASASSEMHCVVYFRVLRNGTIQSPTIEAPSGNFLFDQAALRAVTQASPLPPLPGGFGDEFLGVHFGFAYERD